MSTYRTAIEIPVVVEYNILPADTLGSGEEIAADVEIQSVVIKGEFLDGDCNLPPDLIQKLEDEIYKHLKEQKGNP